jgi:UDP-2-acetamido-2,6-beta-L-arabino-hexul-4-ose reductase
VPQVLVTGSSGFIGRNLVAALERKPEATAHRFTHDDSLDALEAMLAEADAVFHLAGVNRPESEDDFERVNVGLTEQICRRLERLGRASLFVLASSSQAELDNPYGRSKRRAEEVVSRFAEANAAPAVIFRLRNVFGKWARPNYNSVVATFCHNVAHGLPISVSDPAREVSFVYVDDVVAAFLDLLDNPPTAGTCDRREVGPVYPITLGALAEKITAFRASRKTLHLPDFSDAFPRCLYATYLSYLGEGDFAYPLEIRADNRGELAEFIKSPSFGQVFVSRTKPGITRGNHYHHTKVEKFLVLEGQAVVRFRQILDGQSGGGNVIEYPVSGRDFRVVDIPPGYTHSIENVGSGELVVLFWASEVFDLHAPDTYYQAVLDA